MHTALSAEVVPGLPYPVLSARTHEMIHQECLYKLWSPVPLCEPIISSIVSSCWVCQPILNLETLPGQSQGSPGHWPSL